MPFDKLKAPSTAEGLRVDTERRFLPRFENRRLPASNVSNMRKRDVRQKSWWFKESFWRAVYVRHHQAIFPNKLEKPAYLLAPHDIQRQRQNNTTTGARNNLK